MFIICQLTKERGKTWFNIGVTQWRFFRQHEFSLKYSPLITSFYQNHYQNDNQIVHRCYMQTRLPIHDLCTFKKWHLLVRIIVVIIQNIGHSRLLPTLLYQNSFVEWIVWKHLLLHDQVLANKDLVDLESSSQWSKMTQAISDGISILLLVNIKFYHQLKITIEMAIKVTIKMAFPVTAFANEQWIFEYFA